ncbi:MAG: hypothetical protein NT062_08200 [Proteobacteria bacterium]|nr:hypothetical protein [Pseudomonadota bacterium]
MMIRTTLVVAVLAGCSKPPPASPRASPETSQCAPVADALLAAYVKLKHATPTDELARPFRELVVERCTQDVWSAEAQRCMLDATADLDRCTTLLTAPQQQTFQDQARATLSKIVDAKDDDADRADRAEPPPDKASRKHHEGRANQPKGGGTSNPKPPSPEAGEGADPCEGGE